MGWMVDKYEDVKFILTSSKRLFVKAANSKLSRILFLTVTTLSIPALYITTYYYSASFKSQVYKNHQSNVHYASQINAYDSSIEDIELCINAREIKEEVKKWYCQRANASFENTINSPLTEEEKMMTSLQAFGAMRNHLIKKKRNLSHIKLQNKITEQEFGIHNLVLADNGLLVVGIFSTIWLILVCSLFYSMGRKSVNN